MVSSIVSSDPQQGKGREGGTPLFVYLTNNSLCGGVFVAFESLTPHDWVCLRMVTSADPTAEDESAVPVTIDMLDDPMCRLSAQLRASGKRVPLEPGKRKGRGEFAKLSLMTTTVIHGFLVSPMCNPSNGGSAVCGTKGHPHVSRDDIPGRSVGSTMCILLLRGAPDQDREIRVTLQSTTRDEWETSLARVVTTGQVYLEPCVRTAVSPFTTEIRGWTLLAKES